MGFNIWKKIDGNKTDSVSRVGTPEELRDFLEGKRTHMTNKGYSVAYHSATAIFFNKEGKSLSYISYPDN